MAKPSISPPTDGEAPSSSGGVPSAIFAHALAGSKISIWSADREGRYTWIFNQPLHIEHDVVGKRESEFFPAKAAEALSQARSSVLENGESRELEIEVTAGNEARWYEVCVRPQRDDAGAFVGTVASAIDITDRKVQEEHLRIVLRELAHRSKNLLAVIQGIARQTAESAASTQQFVSRFNGRIYSLSRAHDVLTDADWRAARIFDLVRAQIALIKRFAHLHIDNARDVVRPGPFQ